MTNTKRGVLLVVSLLALVSCLPLAAENASAAPTTQVLYTDTTVLCEAFVTDGYVPVSSSTAAYQVYSTAPGHDDHPGYVYWGNASSSTVGSFGIARVKLDLTDPTGELAGYYRVNIYTDGLIFRYPSTTPLSMVPGCGPAHLMSSRIGWGYSTPELGTYYQVGDWGPQEAGPLNFYEDINMDLEARPWSLAEVQAMYVEVDLRFDAEAVALVYGTGGAIRQILTDVYVWAEPAEYTPPPVPTYGAESFILRPDGDVVNATMNSSETTVFDALNEMNYHSDADNSYIWTVPGVDCSAILTMTDPETWQLADYYRCTLWVIAKTNDTDPPVDAWWVGLTGGSHFAVYGLGLYGSYANHSQMYPCDGQSSDLNWTFGQLCNMTVSLMEFENTNITMSQLAVIVEAFSYGPDYGGMTDMSGMARFLMNGGFAAILGLLGFGLVCAAPILMVVKNREDDTMLGFFLAVLVGIFGLVFLWAGLAGHWG